MGFDQELARVAITAAGGDIDRAVRIMLEDSMAHNARQVAEWEFEGDKGWAAFDCDTDLFLSEAYGSGDSACELRVGGNRYLVDFDSLTQLNLSSHRTRRIRKRGAEPSYSSTDQPLRGNASGSSSAPAVHEKMMPSSHGGNARSGSSVGVQA